MGYCDHRAVAVKSSDGFELVFLIVGVDCAVHLLEKILISKDPIHSPEMRIEPAHHIYMKRESHADKRSIITDTFNHIFNLEFNKSLEILTTRINAPIIITANNKILKSNIKKSINITN